MLVSSAGMPDFAANGLRAPDAPFGTANSFHRYSLDPDQSPDRFSRPASAALRRRHEGAKDGRRIRRQFWFLDDDEPECSVEHVRVTASIENCARCERQVRLSSLQSLFARCVSALGLGSSARSGETPSVGRAVPAHSRERSERRRLIKLLSVGCLPPSISSSPGFPRSRGRASGASPAT